MHLANRICATVLACLLLIPAERALADLSCAADLGGIPLIPGRPGEPQPGEAFEIPGIAGSYKTNCSYQGSYDTGDIVIRIVATWNTVQGGDLYGCSDLRGLEKESDLSDKTGSVLRSKDHQAMVDVTVTDADWLNAAKGRGDAMLQEVAGQAGKCRQPQ
jgi:hypothetical protein